MRRRRRRRGPGLAAGELLTLRVGELVAGGTALARTDDGRVVLVAFAAPGELVSARVDRTHPDYLEASTEQVLEPSPDRVEPGCPLFGDCGGCQLQHLAYAAQLRAKEHIVREQLERIGKFAEPPVRPIVGAPDPWGYRNHVRFSTGQRHGDVGFVSRRTRGLLKVEHCPITDPWINGLLPELQGRGRGLHQVQVRHNPQNDSYLVSPAIEGLSVETGQPWYVERLGGRDFQVSDAAFFQVNWTQAEVLVRMVREAVGEPGGLLVDAFAGVGTFAALLAPGFDRVIAIEESTSAGRDALVNLAGLPNVEFRVGKVERLLPELEQRPDVVILDPPRPGCMPAVLSALVEFEPRRIVYVSCNPATLARDLRALVAGGFALESVTPIDMFPQTAHIESVSVLVRPLL